MTYRIDFSRFNFIVALYKELSRDYILEGRTKSRTIDAVCGKLRREKDQINRRNGKKGKGKTEYVATHRISTFEVYNISRCTAHRCYRFSITASLGITQHQQFNPNFPGGMAGCPRWCIPRVFWEIRCCNLALHPATIARRSNYYGSNCAG